MEVLFICANLLAMQPSRAVPFLPPPALFPTCKPDRRDALSYIGCGSAALCSSVITHSATPSIILRATQTASQTRSTPDQSTTLHPAWHRAQHSELWRPAPATPA